MNTKKLRWLFFIPAGIFELFLAMLAGLLATVHYVASVALDIAYKLPSMEWYTGGDYKRKYAPNGYPIMRPADKDNEESK